MATREFCLLQMLFLEITSRRSSASVATKIGDIGVHGLSKALPSTGIQCPDLDVNGLSKALPALAFNVLVSFPFLSSVEDRFLSLLLHSLKDPRPCGLALCTGLISFPSSLLENLTLPLPSPQDPRSSVPRRVGDSHCDFFGNLVALLFCIVFRCFLGLMLTPVSFSTCAPKSIKNQENRSQDAIHLGLRFLFGFWSV